MGSRAHSYREGKAIRVRGQVQGVGFRPFVWQLARRMGLAGDVLNDAAGVLIRVAGPDHATFVAALRDNAPPLARIDAIEVRDHLFTLPPKDFVIAPSGGGVAATRVTPDAATCPACLAEIADPAARRFGYAFTNCTHCGPRFSILAALPYDRANTSMAGFAMCPDCGAEYADPADRRFHAQPIACPACGPRAWLEVDGREVPGDAVTLAAMRLRAGQIVAVKGLGGFHLACDATNADAIATLRARKHRPTKPFALMGSLDMIAAHANLSVDETAVLTDSAAPILLLQGKGTLPDGLAPGLDTLGWMLPSTPLHHLLVAAAGHPLVMTSGNVSGAPMVTDNDEARLQLTGIADALLLHDRDILRRLDDGVERLGPAGPMVLRRARGRCPATLPLPEGFADAPQVMALGGQMKGALCFLKDGQALLGHHLGDLDEAESWAAFLQAEADYRALLETAPSIVACDLHPDFATTRHAQAGTLPVVHVQHHHAHLAACLADNLWARDGGPVAGIILDGLGLGEDGTIWGGEVLLGSYAGVIRTAHLAPAPLPGGAAAQREPWRNLLVRLDAAGLAGLADALLPDVPRGLIRQAVAAGINAPLSSSAGRLFDAVAAALGLVTGAQGYEGEAAMRLEALARAADNPAPPYPMTETDGVIDPAPLFVAMAADLDAGIDPAMIAARFHAGLARAFCGVARELVQRGQAVAVALSGGCFQNTVLLRACLDELAGVSVLTHRTAPAGDGGLALGQAMVAAAQALEGQ
ncbi:MAG: carbamoyltransferase HypF [Limimaricola sp.]|uniref:carbamoyltransferase HypF n=1 Tax=Limimaricola sp. TaxID=2211665 RepID=UPI001D36FFE3|nr:carbamoyltransferase HypF [Limimaricola sp.]MBI1418271.1 carbamoyltransferase HypF [Limimaricola sp.]